MELTREFLTQELAALRQQQAHILQAQRETTENVGIIAGAIQTTRAYLKVLDDPEPKAEGEPTEDGPEDGSKTMGYVGDKTEPDDDVVDENGDPLDGPH